MMFKFNTPFKTKSGEISPEPTWVWFHKEYMYISQSGTFFGLIKEIITSWKDDRNLVM